jgi:hypothetical protein
MTHDHVQPSADLKATAGDRVCPVQIAFALFRSGRPERPDPTENLDEMAKRIARLGPDATSVPPLE